MKQTKLTITITGEPGSGKSTLAMQLIDLLQNKVDSVSHVPGSHEVKVTKYWRAMPRETLPSAEAER